MPFDQWLGGYAVLVNPFQKPDVVIAEKLTPIDFLQQSFGPGQAILFEPEHQGCDGAGVLV